VHQEATHTDMAKRVRGSVRPGQRRPIDRRPASAASSAAAPKPAGLSDAELARAAELEEQLLAEERAAEDARKRTAQRTVARDVTPVRAIAIEDEYAYVKRDVRDIVRIAALLLAILFGLYILIDVAGVVHVG
jgi:hypothetical protein